MVEEAPRRKKERGGENEIPGGCWHGVGAAMDTGLAFLQQILRKVGNTKEGIKE